MSNFLNFNGNQGMSFKTFTASGTSYTLDKSASTNSVLVSVGGVMQQPGVDYTVSGTTLTSTSAWTAGVQVDTFIIHKPGTAPTIQDNSIDSDHYVDGSIDTAHIAANAIDGTLTKDALIADYSDVTITASDLIMYGDATDSNNTKRDTVQGILDLAGSGLVHLSSQTASSSSSLDFTQISSTYNTYLFLFENVLPATDNQSFGIRTSTDGGSSYDSSSANYRRTGFWENGGSVTANADTQTLGYFVSPGVSNTAAEGGVCGRLELYNPLGTSKTLWVATTVASDGTNDPATGVFGGHRESAADVDAVQFLYGSGNIASGTIRMFGYAKS